MNWDRAIEVNREGLLRLLAALFASLERVTGGSTSVLPRFVRANVWRSVRPAASAVRRLVFVTAHLLLKAGFSVKPHISAAGSFPKSGIACVGENRPLAFPLFDPQKRFVEKRRKFARHGPRIWCFDGSDPEFDPFVDPPVPLPDDPVDAAQLLRRLEAVKLALEDLPRQAKRLLRAQARRENALPGPRRMGPLRPGFPPGHVSKSMRQVDEVLRDCSWLARRVLEPADTS